ncbi:hypothetical protein COD88_28490 [Bacillus cereus]|nr:hypothetical protein COD88_28490 [Bacillus cereus]
MLFLLPILLYLHSFCALLSLTLQLATRLLFLLPISPYLHSFCTLLSLTLQLATVCSSYSLLPLTYIPLRFLP